MTTIPAHRLATPRVNAMRRDLTNHRDTIATIDRTVAPAMIAFETRNDGWPSGSGGGNGVSDPVGSQIARLSDALEIDAQLRLAWVTMIESALTVRRLLGALSGTQRADTTKEAEAARCDGGSGEWADPTCSRNAVRSYVVDGSTHELCDACRKRGQRDGAEMFPLKIAPRLEISA